MIDNDYIGITVTAKDCFHYSFYPACLSGLIVFNVDVWKQTGSYHEHGKIGSFKAYKTPRNRRGQIPTPLSMSFDFLRVWSLLKSCDGDCHVDTNFKWIKKFYEFTDRDPGSSNIWFFPICETKLDNLTQSEITETLALFITDFVDNDDFIIVNSADTKNKDNKKILEPLGFKAIDSYTFFLDCNHKNDYRLKTGLNK